MEDKNCEGYDDWRRREIDRLKLESEMVSSLFHYVSEALCDKWERDDLKKNDEKMSNEDRLLKYFDEIRKEIIDATNWLIETMEPALTQWVKDEENADVGYLCGGIWHLEDSAWDDRIGVPEFEIEELDDKKLSLHYWVIYY